MKNHSSRKFVLAAIAALALVASALQAQAQNTLVTFDLTQLQDNLATQTMTVSGITMTITTSDDWGGNTGAINVNNEGLIVYGDLHTNSFTITFDKEVTYDSYTVGNDITGAVDDNLRRLQLQNFDFSKTLNLSVMTMNITALTQGTHEFTTKISTDANETLWYSGNFRGLTTPWRWSALTVTAVPEPASYALLLGFGAFIFIMIRHRIRR